MCVCVHVVLLGCHPCSAVAEARVVPTASSQLGDRLRSPRSTFAFAQVSRLGRVGPQEPMADGRWLMMVHVWFFLALD